MSETTKKWYVVRAVSGKEKKVKLYIEDEISRLGLSDYVTQVLIPTEKLYQIRKGKKISKERSFFPGYILIEADLVGEVPHVIKNVNNVIGFLGAEKGGDPVPLRMAEVNRILGKVDELAESEEELNIPFIVGFGISTHDDVKFINSIADGAVVGSSLIKKIDKKNNIVKKYIKQLKGIK